MVPFDGIVRLVLATQFLQHAIEGMTDKARSNRWTRWSVAKSKVNLKALSALSKEFLKGTRSSSSGCSCST
jgi:hypothetical protein